MPRSIGFCPILQWKKRCCDPLLLAHQVMLSQCLQGQEGTVLLSLRREYFINSDCLELPVTMTTRQKPTDYRFSCGFRILTALHGVRILGASSSTEQSKLKSPALEAPTSLLTSPPSASPCQTFYSLLTASSTLTSAVSRTWAFCASRELWPHSHCSVLHTASKLGCVSVTLLAAVAKYTTKAT